MEETSRVPSIGGINFSLEDNRPLEERKEELLRKFDSVGNRLVRCISCGNTKGLKRVSKKDKDTYICKNCGE
jgi:dihydroorotate dehydrogenase